MKKLYIKPENTVVRVSLETLIAQSPAPAVLHKGITIEHESEIGAREVIQPRDAWEEW